MRLAKKGERWVFDADVDSTGPAEGIKRKVLAYCDEAMCVANYFEKGAIGALHSHPHTQITYVAEGVFEFEIEGEKKVVKKGDTMLKQNGVLHGTLCVEDGILVDFFTPKREDFVSMP